MVQVDATYPQRKLKASGFLGALLGSKGILASQHLYKRMTLVLVDNASLDGAKSSENVSQLLFGTSATR